MIAGNVNYQECEVEVVSSYEQNGHYRVKADFIGKYHQIGDRFIGDDNDDPGLILISKSEDTSEYVFVHNYNISNPPALKSKKLFNIGWNYLISE